MKTLDKKQFETSVLEIQFFATTDVITTSGIDGFDVRDEGLGGILLNPNDTQGGML